MSIIGSNILAGAAGSGVSAYEIEQSLRFDGTSRLTRTPSSTGNTKTWTWSGWVKRSGFGANGMLWSAHEDLSTNADQVRFLNGDSEEKLCVFVSDTAEGALQTSAVYRDPSAWMHVVIRYDTTQATAANRIRIYVNGSETPLSTNVYPSQDYAGSAWNRSGEVQAIGCNARLDDTDFFNGYMSEVHLVDGTSLDPDNFGEYDDNGVWRPIEYTGSYGTNGFYLKFDETATNGVGHDHSGNGNNFTANNITTSGTGTDVMSDTPTTNWCTANPLAETGSNVDIENGNLVVKATSSGDGAVDATIAVPSSGKFYVEATLIRVTGGINQFRMGLQPTNDVAYARPGDNTDSYGFRWNESAGNFAAYDEGTETTYGSGTAIGGEIVGIAIDRDNGEIKTHINNTYFNSGNAVITGIPTTDDYLFRMSVDGGAAKQVGATLNFGQREFAFPPGTASATDYFNTVTYTGTGAEQSITGVGFQPDFVWIKSRSNTHFHALVDVVRGNGGSGSFLELFSNSNASEQQYTGRVTSLDSDGFTVGTDSQAGVNTSSDTYVAWCWKAGGTASANTDGTLNSSVSANNDAGFSVVTYTGNGTSGATVGHGLSAAPSVIFVKLRETATDSNDKDWAVYHSSVDASAPEDYNLTLNSTAARSDSTGSWNDTAPSSSVFTVGNNFTVNNNGKDYVAYCWTDKAGVVKTGSYEGNGLVDGPTVDDIGFKPAMVIIKNVDAVDDWNIIDSKRDANDALRPNSNSAEDDAVMVQLTQSGFKVATEDSHRINYSGETFVYIAFAENLAVDADYKALNTANLPAPEVEDGSEYFTTLAYSGTGSTDSKVIEDSQGNDWAPDFVWLKKRNSGANHMLYDRVRGASESLRSNTTGAEVTGATNGDLTAFTSTGFTLDSGGDVNGSGNTYAAWNWLAGGSGSSNTNGDITSTVSVNATAGFSIVSYTASGTDNDTVGHGLGVAPSFHIVKSRDSARDWLAYTREIDGSLDFLRLNTTAAAANSSANAPTSTVFSIYGADINTAGEDCIAYCFAEVEGFSKISSYTANANSDGPFIYCGFKPALIIFKNTSTTEAWSIFDSTRNDYNGPDAKMLLPSSNAAEATSSSRDIDFLSNGFKLRAASGNNPNTNSGNVYIFAAFAEHPFGGDGVSPVTAR